MSIRLKDHIRNWLTENHLIHYYRAYTAIRAQKALYRAYQADRAAFELSGTLTGTRFAPSTIEEWPIYTDRIAQTPFEAHYIYHPAWAARILAKTRPDRHVDISSTLHFCSLISAFLPVDFYDYRPAILNLEGLTTGRADLLDLPFGDGSILSLSCMHTLEHIGLGRYGDPIDYDGDLKAAAELQRVLAINGDLLMVVPVGQSKIAFNAHRVYGYEQVLSCFAQLQLVEFALLPDRYENGMITGATADTANAQIWGCGCFWFKKITP
jgi:hypothetical protein